MNNRFRLLYFFSFINVVSVIYFSLSLSLQLNVRSLAKIAENYYRISFLLGRLFIVVIVVVVAPPKFTEKKERKMKKKYKGPKKYFFFRMKRGPTLPIECLSSNESILVNCSYRTKFREIMA